MLSRLLLAHSVNPVGSVASSAMPASETQKQRSVLLTVVFWTGVGLAPLAAALVLLSSGATGLRVAAVLAILAVVLIGLAIMLRPDAAGVRAEVEEMVFDELDVLRDDVREDISTAARATHRAFAEKLQQLYETVEMLREQVEAARAQGYQPPAKATPPPAGRAAPNPSVGTAMVGGGVVRHTETVQVTTRSTIVDPHDDRSGTVYGGSGKVYAGGRPPAEPAAAPAGRRAAAEPADERGPERDRRADWAPPREESWTEQRLRERMAAQQREAPRDRDARDEFPDEARRPRPFDRDDARDEDAGDDPRWTDVRAGDRWASVRSDDRGRELRMGERRAAVHSDGAGTELRIEDRWAQVRREDANRRGERWEPEATGFGDASGSWSDGSWSDGGWDRRAGTPALPAPPAEPASSWTQGWHEEREPAREPVRRRREEDRDDRWEREDTDRGPARPRRPEFEVNDERWR